MVVVMLVNGHVVQGHDDVAEDDGGGDGSDDAHDGFNDDTDHDDADGFDNSDEYDVEFYVEGDVCDDHSDDRMVLSG